MRREERARYGTGGDGTARYGMGRDGTGDGMGRDVAGQQRRHTLEARRDGRNRQTSNLT